MNIPGPDSERAALEQFKARIRDIEAEVATVDRALARRDLIALAHRARDAIRSTRSLLDRNAEILFDTQPVQFHQDLHSHLEFAEGHINRALSEEIDFPAIEKRLSLAVRLAEDVLRHVSEALQIMEQRIEAREDESA